MNLSPLSQAMAKSESRIALSSSGSILVCRLFKESTCPRPWRASWSKGRNRYEEEGLSKRKYIRAHIRTYSAHIRSSIDRRKKKKKKKGRRKSREDANRYAARWPRLRVLLDLPVLLIKDLYLPGLGCCEEARRWTIGEADVPLLPSSVRATGRRVPANSLITAGYRLCKL